MFHRRFTFGSNPRRGLAAVIVIGLVGVGLSPMIRKVSAQSSADRPNADGIVGGGLGGKASQGSGPLVKVLPDDSRLKEVFARNAAVPGPSVKTGPGEVALVPFQPLPPGSKSAVDLVAAPRLPVGPTVPVAVPVGAAKG